MASQFKLYKLIVLYMLNSVDFPLTNSQISEFILSQGYTDYFKLQQVINELSEDGFLTIESTQNRTICHLTREGAQTIQMFSGDISAAIQDDIDSYMAENKNRLRSEINVKADCFPNGNGEYTVNCRVMEQGNPLIELTLRLPSKNQAEKIVHNWNTKSQEVYAMIIKTLL